MQVWIQKYDEEMGAAEQIYQEELAQTNQVIESKIPDQVLAHAACLQDCLGSSPHNFQQHNMSTPK